MAPPDLRSPGDDLTERYGPVAPKPAWKKREPYYNRERFILRIVVWIVGVQFGFYIAATIVCANFSMFQMKQLSEGKRTLPVGPICTTLSEKLQGSVDQGLAVMLALLGGGALALSERREQPRQDPRRGGGDQP